MECNVCGLEYGMTHNCAGIAPAILPEDSVPPPSGFAPLHYLIEAVRIATWDDAAIRRISRDPNAPFYGIVIWAMANSFPFAIIAVQLCLLGRGAQATKLLFGLSILLPVAALWALLQIGLCFLLAKWFMAGEGRFVQSLRPLLLGSVVLVLATIPYVGVLVAAIAWIAVFAMVFQEINGIAPLSAYLLSACVGIFIRVLQFTLLPYFK